ncbi:MAG: 5'-methylthioadenosine/adenosylhomocysteine nucleosidase [Clostridiales bacterium]|nr:MAG: 5'-methylthioadenosine/adenosylhomocysteine nucleosidase [Clostridiales bacterium]
MSFCRGKISGKDAVVAKMRNRQGFFASVCAEAMILRYNPDVVVNIGVAGTLTDELNTTDIAVAKSVVHHDLDTSPLGDPAGLISGINIINIECDEKVSSLLEKCVKSLGINCKTGVIASGDQFVCTTERKNFIRGTFNAIACEMEGASIGHVCFINGTKFGVLRAISDGADEKNRIWITTNLFRLRQKNSFEVIKRFIEEY